MDSGIRAVFGYGNANAEWLPISEISTNYDDVRRVKKKYFSKSDQLVTMALAPRGAQYTTMEITEADFKVARDLGLRITVAWFVWRKHPPVVVPQSQNAR
jgi:5-methylthioadenosine/S-adenosylhomocysteine deaminase